MSNLIKIYNLLLCYLAGVVVVYGQGAATTLASSTQVRGQWYKQSAESGVVGIGLHAAQELVKNRVVRKEPVVAVIGSGMDLDHTALAHAVWINSGKPHKNYVNYSGAVHGWNFISNASGKVMEKTLTGADREWLRFKDLYAAIFYDGQRSFVYNKAGEREYVATPTGSDYAFFKMLQMSQRSILGSSFGAYQASFLFKEYVKKWDALILAAYPERKGAAISHKEAEEVVSASLVKTDSLGSIAATVVFLYGNMLKSYVKEGVPSWQMLYDNFMNRQHENAYKTYEQHYAKLADDQRNAIVGDRVMDVADRDYGSGQIFTAASTLGTLLSGIIAAKEEDEGSSGIMPSSKLMHLVVQGESGEAYPKDLTLAIRYAVDHGADIILLPTVSRFYTLDERKWIDEAMKLAEKKGILVITSVWENAENMDKTMYYPNQTAYDGHRYKHLMVVGNSTEKGEVVAYANYGAGEVSVYAPGVNIYATVPGDVYKLASSSGFGAAVTAGSAAFLKAYFPELSGPAIKKLLMDHVTSYKGREVEKRIALREKSVIDLFLFEQLCTSGGILNLEAAVAAAVAGSR